MKHFEGIGSEFQWHKPSFLATHFLRGKWIGNLINGHQIKDGDISSYFGLNNSDCNEKSLLFYKDVHPNRFIYMPKKETHEYLLSLVRDKITRKTVLVYDWETLDESHNYAIFDLEFRKKFHQQRLQRHNRIRNKDEFWVSIHFRWGDVQTNDPNQPDVRNGLGLLDYCVCVKEIRRIKPQATIHFFAENFNKSKFCVFCNIVCTKFQSNGNFYFYNDSTNWMRDLDIMSQSQIILGGSSSFFVLAAHLCQNCTVIHDSWVKFAKKEHEKNLPKHMNDYFCGNKLRCYIESITKTIS